MHLVSHIYYIEIERARTDEEMKGNTHVYKGKKNILEGIASYMHWNIYSDLRESASAGFTAVCMYVQ